MGEDVEATITKGTLNMPKLPNILNLEEKKYLLAVERGDLANVRRVLQKAQKKKNNVDINCMDSFGRGALTIAIDQENLELVELLVVMGVDTKDSLLHAINVEFVEAVELLLEHEELIHQEGEPYSWQKVDINTAMFTPDITPLVLAAHRNNYEILKILLDRGATVPMPHDIKCGCEECIRQSEEDSLRHSLSRLNEYRALASPCLISLSSSDPLLTAFQLSWELRGLAFAEPECKAEYMDLRRQCQKFAVDLLHQSRNSQELAIILNHDPGNPPYEEGEHMKLARLELAIMYKQKKFVAHPNIQQLLATIWYEGVPGFRRKTTAEKVMIIVRVALLFPFYSLLYIFAPDTKTGKLMRKPFMKFLIHASSYLFFLLLLILVSLRADDLVLEYLGSDSMKAYVVEKYDRQRGNPPTILECAVLLYVIGFIIEETQEMFVEGMNSYLRNLWNFIDFSRNVLYTAVFVLRVASYFQQTAEIERDPLTAYIRREDWSAFDPQLIAEGLFAAANIFSALKLVHLFSINPHLGPLQISLGRMVIDIVKFFFIYTLVLFAFACGLNQLLWYFSDLERKKCFHLPNDEPDFDGAGDSCMKWRRFANVFESSQSLFWASFGMVDLDSFELAGIKTYTRFWGLLMFGSYSVINVIVLLNLLIAMMSNSYAIIDEHSDTEWKFARTKLWMRYFEETGTLPPPFNVFPKPKNFLKLFGMRKKDKMRRMSTKRRNKQEKERDFKYSAVMRALVWRYVSTMHRKCEESVVTEDDVNEVKSDISSFRYEMIEILGRNGMDVSSAAKKEKVVGKKMKVWERRLMKDFKVAPIAPEDSEELFAPPPENESSQARFRRIARLALLSSNLSKWQQVVRGAQIALFETSQSLFWASFGLVDLMAFELTGIKSFTRFWALLMFGSYSVINIIVLLNMLIAMMSNSYQIISDMMTQLKRTSIRNQVEEYLFETSQSLFWASFGLIDIISFELTGIKSFTRFWALLMFGSYSVINIIVLLNMLIAMMSNSYQIISERSDTEWKFARSRLWINYFDEDDPLPAPFNMLPTQDMLGCKKNKISTKSFKEKSKDKAREKHEAVMRLLVRRYVTAEQRKRDDYGITEDDVMEIRQDISSLRYELIDILRKNGMQTPEIKYQDVQLSGKKGKVMERRLLKDFHIGIVEGLVQEMSQNTEPKNIFGQLAKVIGRRTTSKSKKKDWNALVRKSSVKSDPIGSQQGMENSIAKRQSLRKHILTNVTQLQNLDDTMLIEYNPLLSEVPRGARVAWAKFMTKKITVDYNQETMNSTVANEQPKREPKPLKEKQHSLISLRSQASQKSQDQLSIKSLTQKIAEKNPVDEPKPVLENTSERLENPDTFTNECRSKCLSPLLETNSPVESRATTPQDLEKTDLQNDNVQEGQEEMKELPEKKVEKNDTMQKKTEKKSEGKSIKEKSSISKKPKDETKDSSASASEKDNEPPVIPPTQRSKLTGKTRTGWI